MVKRRDLQVAPFLLAEPAHVAADAACPEQCRRVRLPGRSPASQGEAIKMGQEMGHADEHREKH